MNMEPLATYSTSSIQWKNSFSLFPDSVVIRYSRGVFGTRGEERYLLKILDPGWTHTEFRESIFSQAGGMIAAFSLIVCFRLLRADAISWLLFSLAASVGVFGVWLICVGFRKAERAQFHTETGIPLFNISRYGSRRETFDSFVEALTRQIRITKGSA